MSFELDYLAWAAAAEQAATVAKRIAGLTAAGQSVPAALLEELAARDAEALSRFEAVTEDRHSGRGRMTLCSTEMLEEIHRLRADLAESTLPPADVMVAANTIEHLVGLCHSGRFDTAAFLLALQSLTVIEATSARARAVTDLIVAGCRELPGPPD